MSVDRHPEVSRYQRNAAQVTNAPVLHALQKAALVAEAPLLKRKRVKAQLEQQWEQQEQDAAATGSDNLESLRDSCDAMLAAMERIAKMRLPGLIGKVEGELIRVRNARNHIDLAIGAIGSLDFGEAGASAEESARQLRLAGGSLTVVLNQQLRKAAFGKDVRAELQENARRQKQAKVAMHATQSRPADSLPAAARLHRLQAEGLDLVADVLAAQAPAQAPSAARGGRETNELRIVQPQDLPTFADVGGLADVKAQLKATIGTLLERPDEAARYQVVHNGILFHGPPGTGKTLLSKALAGEYGLRYIRFSPASIASAYIHEAAANLQRLFELAAENTPCLLFLDEVDTIAGARDGQPSADHREVVTQLMNSLEEYRTVHGLVIAAATNNIDLLDPGLREGRFDARILVPLPDPEARRDIFQVCLEKRSASVAWETLDLMELAVRTGGRNAAALEGFASRAAQTALGEGRKIDQTILLDAIGEREGKDRTNLDHPVRWDDVVLPDPVRQRVMEILHAFTNPDLARKLGIRAPAGILLHGPPGTGKTTIAKAIATEVAGSFYEQSAADLLSKWAGESEERVAKLFAKARANRPSIIFIDEIDSLLRKRTADSTTPWEERVIGQFLRELDGLSGAEGVLLVGATNRPDIVDPAIHGRRLTPVEVGLPDRVARFEMLNLLFRDVAVDDDVDLRSLAAATEGMSGADLKRLRDSAGMKSLSRVARSRAEGDSGAVSVTSDDVGAALGEIQDETSLMQV